MAGGEHGEGGRCSDRGAPPLPSAAWRGSLAGTPSRPFSSFLLPLSPFLGFDSMEPLLAPTELNSPKAGVTLSVQGGSLERRLVPVFRIRGHCHHRQMSPTMPRWTRQPVRRPRPRTPGGGGSLRSENGFALLATRHADSFTAARPDTRSAGGDEEMAGRGFSRCSLAATPVTHPLCHNRSSQQYA